MNRKERRAAREPTDEEMKGPTGIVVDMANELKRYLRERGCESVPFMVISVRGIGGSGDLLGRGPALLRAIAHQLESGGYHSVTPLEPGPEEN